MRTPEKTRTKIARRSEERPKARAMKVPHESAGRIPLEGVRYAHNEAMKATLREVYGYIIEANRLAVLRRQGCIAESAKRSLARRGRRLN